MPVFVAGDFLCHGGDSFDGVVVESDSDQHDADGVVVADLQVEGREELALQFFGQLGDPGLEHGDLVEQVCLVVLGGRIGLDLGEFLSLGTPLHLQF
ncbi:hypothetical protein [Nonomuraea insulae]|uniref:Uncharacterized protein n=1 Tax=Nonomuraea insulae TaxID=1616787 RepID=A0ABW1D088_9ACTN